MSGTEPPEVVFLPPDQAGAARGAPCRADAEHEGRAPRHKGKEGRRPGRQRGQDPRHEGRQRRLHRVYEPQALVDEATGEQVAGEAGSQGQSKLDHDTTPNEGATVTFQYGTPRMEDSSRAGDSGRGGAMKKHPTIRVPDIGLMDHAWDLLGEWQAEFELPDADSPVRGQGTFRSWPHAELHLDPIEAAIAGIPSNVSLERASEVHLTDAGGGALQWVLHAPSTNWALQATMWPGSLHLFVSDAEDEDEQLYRARATRNREYYLRKYPMGCTEDKPVL